MARSSEDCKGLAAELPEAELPEAELPEAELPEAELPEAELPEFGVPKIPWMKSVPPVGLLLKLLELDAGFAELEDWLAAEGVEVDPSDPRLPD